jgi:hypothetical protein
LAGRTAPPNLDKMTKEDPATTLASIAALVVSSAVAFFAYQLAGLLWAGAGFVVVCIGIGLFGASLSSVGERFREAKSEWDRKYMCMKCGATILQPYGAYRAAAKRSSEDPELDRFIREGQIGQAVTHVQERTGVGLSEAVYVVEDRTRLLS